MEYNGRVVFVGAGPGDPELITVRGLDIIRRADLLIYAGSLVPETMLSSVKTGAEILDSSSMTLEDIARAMKKGARNGLVARIHTGDPSLYGALREEVEVLETSGITWEIVPGITAACAAAARAGVTFTVPTCTQTLMITRLAGKTPMPRTEELRLLASHGTSLAIYLAGKQAETIREELLAGGLSPDTHILCAHRIGWPEEKCVWTTLGRLAETVKEHDLMRQTVFLVLPAEGKKGSPSRLYAADFSHGFRRKREEGEEDARVRDGS
ncbi:MAG: precorrin-4 C(11)-methyltransferase [Desulfovibrio sp.]|nr:precorrin-4 C(11)-methyltransferase [Desulfovibrio sp.]